MTISIISICIAAVLITAIICFTNYKRDTQIQDLKEKLEYYRGRCSGLKSELYDILYDSVSEQKKLAAIASLYNKE